VLGLLWVFDADVLEMAAAGGVEGGAGVAFRPDNATFTSLASSSRTLRAVLESMLRPDYRAGASVAFRLRRPDNVRVKVAGLRRQRALVGLGVCLVTLLIAGAAMSQASAIQRKPTVVKQGQAVAIPLSSYSRVLVSKCGDGQRHEGPSNSTFAIHGDGAKRLSAKPSVEQLRAGGNSTLIQIGRNAVRGRTIIVDWTAVAKGCFSMQGSFTIVIAAGPTGPNGRPQLPCLGPSPTHTKLMSEPWRFNGFLQRALRQARARFQSNREEAPHDFAFDEFSITIEKLPPGMTPEQLLARFAADPNATANNPAFNGLTRFRRRTPGEPRIGTIYDIDIPGDPGSVIIVEKTRDHFVVQTIDLPQRGINEHPVSGAREFGFLRNADGSITFYTRGADRPNIDIGRPFSRWAQNATWNEMMKGLGRGIERQGGTMKSDTPYSWRVDVATGC
jgi:hypothetical protein